MEEVITLLAAPLAMKGPAVVAAFLETAVLLPPLDLPVVVVVAALGAMAAMSFFRLMIHLAAEAAEVAA